MLDRHIGSHRREPRQLHEAQELRLVRADQVELGHREFLFQVPVRDELGRQQPRQADHRAVAVTEFGTGTGIAPFRAFVKHLHQNVPQWKGTITLFYGARSGLELLYMNDERDDFSQYYDEDTFQAFKALSPRPAWAAPIDWDGALSERGAKLWDLLGQPNTYVYVAGLEKMRGELDAAFSEIAGSEQRWNRRKSELTAGGRWVELLY